MQLHEGVVHQVMAELMRDGEALSPFRRGGTAVEDHHNTNPKPFIWTKSARDILQKVIRANNRLSSKQNATLH